MSSARFVVAQRSNRLCRGGAAKSVGQPHPVPFAKAGASSTHSIRWREIRALLNGAKRVASRFAPSPGVCSLSFGTCGRVDGAAIERVVAEQILLEIIEPLDRDRRRLRGAVFAERRFAAEV